MFVCTKFLIKKSTCRPEKVILIDKFANHYKRVFCSDGKSEYKRESGLAMRHYYHDTTMSLDCFQYTMEL